MGITIQLPVQSQEEGGLAVPARRFLEMVRELPESDILLQTRKNQSLLVECGQCLFRLVGLPTEEFPQLPPFPTTGVVSCEQSVVKSMLTLTTFAISTEEARYVLNGSLLTLRDRLLTLVATDGRRLAVATTELPMPAPELRAIVPSKTLRELLRLLDVGPMDIALLTGNQILFRLGPITLISRLIEGEFPNYEKAIPPPVKEKLCVDRAALLAVVRRACLLTTPNSQAVRFELNHNRLHMFKEAAEIGEVREELAVQYTGKPLTIHFNPQYLLDVLKVLPDEEVAWELTSPEKAGVLRTKDYCYIVLPMQPT